jgi:hypothetical protein
MTIKSDGKTYTISLAEHLFENRETLKGTAKKHRSYHINHKRYKQIMSHALKNGLTSFRNKGVAVITFRDSNNRPFGVLTNLEDDNDIFVISVFRGPKYMDLYRCFIKVKNRINITKIYTMEVLQDSEIQENTARRTNYYTEKSIDRSEDLRFLNAMKGCVKC